jgi:multiple sugar transport system permease protein
MNRTADLPLPADAPQRRSGIPLQSVLFHLAAALVAALFLAPIVLVVLASLRPASEAGAPPLPPWPTTGLSADSYWRLEAFGDGLLHYAGNCLLVALDTTILTILVSVLAGYGFSRFRFPMKKLAFVLILSTIMIPFQSILTPLFLILAKLGLQNTLTGLVLLYATLQLPFSWRLSCSSPTRASTRCPF